MSNPEIKKFSGKISEDDFYDIVKEFFTVKHEQVTCSSMNEQKQVLTKENAPPRKRKNNHLSLKNSLLAGDK